MIFSKDYNLNIVSIYFVMIQMLRKEVFIDNLDQLDSLTYQIASSIKAGETFELISDLGGGKTTFVRSLVKHLHSADAVASPSFTIENIYRCRDFQLHHFDFYRLDDAGVCAFELSEALADPEALVIIEWSQLVANLLPAERLIIQFDPAPLPNAQQRRRLVFEAPASLNYLTGNI